MPATKKLKVVAISDLHGYLPPIPKCDLLLIAGDLCPYHKIFLQATWLDTDFRSWLNKVPARKVIGIAGNHDFIFQHAAYLVPELPWTYLQDSATEWEGLKFYGTPWQPIFGNWAFNADDETLKRRWSFIHDDTNVLLSHGPPYTFGDLAPPLLNRRKQWTNVGCKHLLDRLYELERCRLTVFGHIHEGRGEWELGTMKLANVTLVDGENKPTYQPWICELTVPARAGR